MDLAGFGSLGQGLAGIGSFVTSMLGAVKSGSHSSIQKATWGDYRKQAYFDDLAERRAVGNAKELFAYQQMSGPGLSMAGYRNAGLNPILAGNYNGSMPSAPTPSQEPAPKEFVNNAQSLIAAGSALGSLAETLSRIQLNETNAQSIASRTDIEQQLLKGRLALQNADLAYKGALPGYYKAQAEKLKDEVDFNVLRRALLDSQISLNNAREVSMFNHDWLEAERYNFDKDYKNRYLNVMDKSYIGNPQIGKLYFSTIGNLFDRFSRMFGGMFQRGRLPGDVWNPELP